VPHAASRLYHRRCQRPLAFEDCRGTRIQLCAPSFIRRRRCCSSSFPASDLRPRPSRLCIVPSAAAPLTPASLHVAKVNTLRSCTLVSARILIDNSRLLIVIAGQSRPLAARHQSPTFWPVTYAGHFSPTPTTPNRAHHGSSSPQIAHPVRCVTRRDVLLSYAAPSLYLAFHS
jgi:hypothetical protein